jgi:hypothetical protein
MRKIVLGEGLELTQQLSHTVVSKIPPRVLDVDSSIKASLNFGVHCCSSVHCQTQKQATLSCDKELAIVKSVSHIAVEQLFGSLCFGNICVTQKVPIDMVQHLLGWDSSYQISGCTPMGH